MDDGALLGTYELYSDSVFGGYILGSVETRSGDGRVKNVYFYSTCFIYVIYFRILENIYRFRSMEYFKFCM